LGGGVDLVDLRLGGGVDVGVFGGGGGGVDVGERAGRFFDGDLVRDRLLDRRRRIGQLGSRRRVDVGQLVRGGLVDLGQFGGRGGIDVGERLNRRLAGVAGHLVPAIRGFVPVRRNARGRCRGRLNRDL